MKIAHLADLHLGKTMNQFSLIDDQKYILDQIYDKLKKKGVETVLIAGDVYDRAVPSAEAVSLLNDFLTRLIQSHMEVFMIAGNHDSGTRLNFASRLLSDAGLHIDGEWNGKLKCTDLADKSGILHIWTLPFIKPSDVNRFIDEESSRVHTYTEAVRYALSTADINYNERNILVAHQFVTGASVNPDGSEELMVGGVDNVDESVFEGFDYVALGHIHSAQAVGMPTIRYAGTPLKYSFGEAKENKSFTLLDVGEKGQQVISLVSLNPRRDVEEIKGNFTDLLQADMVKLHENNYLHIILTDEEEINEAVRILRAYYPYLMRLDYDNKKTKGDEALSAAEEMEKKTPLDLFAEFYEKRNHQPMSEIQKNYMNKLIEEIWKESE